MTAGSPFLARVVGLALFLCICASTPAHSRQQADPPAQRQVQGPPVGRDAQVGDVDPRCRDDQDAARISGEIVVCRTLRDPDERYSSREESANRYAAATAHRGDAPDFRPPPCVSSLLTWCPKFGKPGPPALIVDVAALPEAPPGSDADRIGRGIAGPSPSERERPGRGDVAVSRAGSEEPAEPE